MWGNLAPIGEELLEMYGLVAIFALMLVKEIGVPVPIPSDLIMLIAAAESAAGRFPVWEAFGIILVAMIVGAWVQYMLVRGFGRPILYRFGRYGGLTQERLDRAAASIRKGGVLAVGFSLITPGVRIGTVPACALAELPYRAFFPGVIVGSGLFLAAHFLVGYVGGPIIAAFVGVVERPIVEFIVALVVLGLAGWILIHRRQLRRREKLALVSLDCLRDWSDGCCPTCLVAGLLHHPEHLRRESDC